MLQLNRPEAVALSPGLTLYAIPTDRFKTARLTVYTVMRADKRLSPRISLLSRVLGRGTEHYPRRSLLNRRLDELYGTVLDIGNSLYGDNHVLSFTVEPLDDAFLPRIDRDMDLLCGSLDVISQIMLHPLRDPDGCLCRDAVEKEKQARRDDIIDRRSRPDAYASDRMRVLLYGDEPAGTYLLGEPDDLMSITAEELTKLWQSWLKHARFEVFYVGQTPAGDVADKWRTAFGDFSPCPGQPLPTLLHKAPTDVRRVDEERPLAQGKLYVCLTSDIDPMREPEVMAAAVLMNELLGGMQGGALLYRYVRGDLGLCYYCDSGYYGSKGVLVVSCGVGAENRQAAEQAIHDCIRRVADGDFTEDDVRMAQASYMSQCRRIPDSASALESVWFDSLINDRVTTDPCTRMEQVLSAGRDDIIAAAKRFRPDLVYYLGGQDGKEPARENGGL